MKGNGCPGSTVVTGNSVDINLKNEILCQSSEIRSDVVVEEFQAKRLWGQVHNCQGIPVANSLVKLVRVYCDNGRETYEGVAHTTTNCEGFYQFDLCAEDLSCYKVIVNKATTGLEAILDNGGGNCNLCQTSGNGCQDGMAYNPCQRQYQEVVVERQHCDCMGDCRGQRPNLPPKCWECMPPCNCRERESCDTRHTYEDATQMGYACQPNQSCNKHVVVNNSAICR